MMHERRHTIGYQTEKKRFFDPKTGMMMVKVLPGEHYVTNEPTESITTVLGSCISACIRDPETGFGGMNHFMLPDGASKGMSQMSSAMRYGHYAMEVLINEILKTGCPRSKLEIKLFGGAKVTGASSSVGEQNAEFVTNYLKNEGLKIAAQDLGGAYARRIHYSPLTGKVDRLLMKRNADKSVFNREKSFAGDISEKAKAAGSVELFE